MKAPWFPFYTGDFLASPDVQLMEAATVGAYTLLLAFSWQSDMPGYIEDDEYTMRRVSRLTAAEWELSKKVLLKKWPLAEDMPGVRYNPRLKKEAEKQVELRGKKAEAGQKSAELKAARKAELERLATQGQHKPNTISTPVEDSATGVPKNANYSQPQPQSSKEDERTAGVQAVSASLSKSTPGEEKVGGPAGKPREYLADEAPIFQAAAFAAFTDKMGYAKIDKGHYLLRIQRKAEKLLARTNEGWENFILTWLDKDQKAHTLQLVDQRAHVQPVDNSRFGPAERPLTTGYSIAARLQEQNANDYL